MVPTSALANATHIQYFQAKTPKYGKQSPALIPTCFLSFKWQETRFSILNVLYSYQLIFVPAPSVFANNSDAHIYTQNTCNRWLVYKDDADNRNFNKPFFIQRFLFSLLYFSLLFHWQQFHISLHSLLIFESVLCSHFCNMMACFLHFKRTKSEVNKRKRCVYIVCKFSNRLCGK